MANLTATNIDVRDPGLAKFLAELQGNILRSHHRIHQQHLFVQFAGEVDAVRSAMRTCILPKVISAARQENLSDEEVFVSLLLTRSGYLALGLQPPSGLTVASDSAPTLNDDPASWEFGAHQQPIDALVLIAAKTAGSAKQEADSIAHAIAPHVAVVAREVGEGIKNPQGADAEHFGYADGVSQPLILADQLASYHAQFGTSLWDPAAPLALAVVKDPHGEFGDDSCGSFMVYRKLEQDVVGFAASVTKLAQSLQSSPDLVGAMAVGRFKDGTAVTNHGAPQGVPATENDFDYGADAAATRCPLHAHIRKTNPRATGIAGTDADKAHRVFRRGIPYGGELRVQSGGTSESESPVGLLFMCYQASIADQFEFMQRLWANNENFTSSGVGVDSVVGIGGAGPLLWPLSHGAPSTGTASTVAHHVTTRTSVYLFAPSMSALRRI